MWCPDFPANVRFRSYGESRFSIRRPHYIECSRTLDRGCDSVPTNMFSTRSATSKSAALEQSNADLTLLTQSLAKSRKITDQMTTRLSDFDDRLARLEKVQSRLDAC